MAVIEFRTLGGLDLRSADGRQLHSLLAQPKRVALLAYLCIANPRGFHRRDALLGLFWPDADDTHARTSLRNALHVLRRTLGDNVLLSHGDEEVAVDFGALRCDILAFEELSSAGRVEEALELYRGDLLAGFFVDQVPAFERWVESERARLRTTAARAARIAAEQREAERNLTGAIAWARRAVELTDTDERSVRRLIELLARVGDRAGALQAYDNFARHLHAEFDAEPSAETQDLFKLLRAHGSGGPKVSAVQPVSKVDATPVPESLPGYFIERELGRGGMATVFLGRDRRHDRSVAIKILRRDIAAMLGTDRFLAEIAIVASLQHPHILPLLDSGQSNGLPYYVMPHTDGETLRTRLQRERTLGVEEAIQITCEVADALAYAHAHGIVHRDIKPENIVLENGHALVTDFGIARALSKGDSQRLTQAGITLGTAAYMSPEQAEGGEEVDGRADVYALGCVLYEMLAGDPPFQGSTAQAILARKATVPAPPLRAVRETVSPMLERSILKALSRVRADRFKTVQEFARSLETVKPVTAFLMSRTAGKALFAVGAVIIIAGSAIVLSRGKLDGIKGSRAVLRDRRLITNTGHVSYPTISPDGKTLAYMLMQCRTRGCTYGIELQEIDGSASRQILDSISELTRVGLEWSPDRRNVLAFGRINGKQGTFLISTLGAPVRHIGSSLFTFWGGSDSLLSYRRSSRGTFWVFVSGLDGVPRDSFPIHTSGKALTGLDPIPNSPWITTGVVQAQKVKWVSFDRTGRIVGSMLPREMSGPPARASMDALWIGARARGSNLLSVVRIPFDPRTGQFGLHEDTLYTGNPTSVGVSADGGTFVVDEGATEYTVWALNLRDAVRGVFPEKRRILTATSELANELSPDGRRLLVGVVSGSTSSEGTHWEVVPLEGGRPSAVAGTPASDFWADSATLTLKTQTSAGVELSLLDVSTGVRRARFVVPDSVMGAFVSLRGEGWAWATEGAIRVYTRRQGLRKFAVPDWYEQVGAMTASRDGKQVVFVGRGANGDSVRVSAMSLTDGVVTSLKTIFGGYVWPESLADGSVMLAVWETGDWVSIYHLRKSGKTDWVTSIPRPVWTFSVSADMRRAAISARDYRADALMSQVVRH
ncbi:MAG: protein kinase [Gemmatimonadaceae bacterium]